ncbi:hypothetical protein KGP17_15070 [Serratia sp. JSRIV001]|uniref:hypothetical protein n=1 Tax=unclassified Serratia (in: enterobacteria) TaxID=2647522 RepID=UPI001CBF5829|nr:MULTISPECIES: hypothetical protein [unclassified Serratia (in: enterobacteria)]UAN43815.1 hypothetical protein KGP17_15070 [Serratia sp. JSRIV001]UAN61002.1 hypothetical protein KGP16_15300 [Serratia sp. JSRIV006]
MGFKGRVVGWVLSALLGVPFTIYGMEFMFLKVVKQQINCIEDVSLSVTTLEPKIGVSMANDFKEIQDSFDNCRKNVDMRKSNIEFIKEEHRRASLPL